jgi:3-oxoadipate enol-lactonase
MGGRIAFDFLRRHPQRVLSLTACSASHRASQMSPQRRAQFLASRLRPLQSGGTPADIAPDVARSLLGPNAPAAVHESLVASMELLRAASYMKALQAVSLYDEAIELESIRVPVHVIAAAADPLIPLDLVRAMAGRIPGCVLTEIADCGHLSNLEQPEAFDRAALEFLRGLGKQET